MDAKITKTRLAQTLSYDWVKVVALALAVIFFWVLIFTWTATRITNTQKYVIHNYFGVSLGDGFYSAYEGYGKGKIFSYEVFEVENVNVNQEQSLGYQLLETRFAVGEADAMIIADIPDPNNYYDAEGNQLSQIPEDGKYVTKSYLEGFARSSYSGYMTRLDDGENGKKGLFTQMKEYLMQFYTVTETTEKTYNGFTFAVATFDEASLNEEEVIKQFTDRVKANKDKRFKTEEEWAQGYKDELARIRSYQQAYKTVFDYLDKGYIALTAWSYDVPSAPWFVKGGAYSINLCPPANEGETPKMDSLKNDFYYRAGEEGKTYTTAENMNVLFVELEGLDGDFKYENILFVNDIVARHVKA